MKYKKAVWILGVVVVFACAFLYGWLWLQDSDTKPAIALSSVPDQYYSCRSLGADKEVGECMHALAIEAYDAYGPIRTAEALDTIDMENRSLWCHEIMHYMGWRSYQKTGSVADAFLESSELCDSGMYHGVMEEYLRTNGLEGNIEGLISTVCVEALKKHPSFSEGTESLCYHGLGHGLMYITSSDLPRSLNYCDTLEPDDAGNCYGGAYMEYVASKQVGPVSNEKDLSDHSYCELLQEHQKHSCYGRQGANNFSFTNGDVLAAMRMCLELEEQYHYECFLGVGGNNPAPSKPHEKAAQDCEGALEISPEAYEGCIQGSMGFVTQLERGEPEGANSFCQVVTDEHKLFCYEKMGESLEYWLPPSTTLSERCSIIDDLEYRKACEQK